MEPMLDLLPYLKAEQALAELEDARSSEREQIMSGVYRQYEVIAGMPVTYSYPTEKAALELIDIDGAYQAVERKHRRRVDMLYKALDRLTQAEREAWDAYVWGGDKAGTTRDSGDYAPATLTYAAIEKVQAYILHQRESLEADVQQRHRDWLREVVREYQER